MQQAVVIPILPRLEHAFGVSLTQASWALTVSLLVGAIATPIAGRAGDMFGHKRVLLAVVALLAAGSIVGALATSLPVFIIARVLQGFAIAVVPLAIGLLRTGPPPARMHFGIGIVSATIGAGNGLGLLLAGVISAVLPGYMALFLIILALAVLGLVLAVALIPAAESPASGRPDFLGAGLLSGALVALLLAIGQGSSWGWQSATTIGLFAAAVILGAIWVFAEQRVSEPLIDIAMLIDRRTIGATLASLLLGFGLFGAFVLIPNFVETPTAAGYGFGATVLKAALFLLPTTILMLVVSLVSGRFVKRFPASWMVTCGSLVTAAALVLIAFAHDSRWIIYVATTVLGVGIGLGFAAIGTMAVEHVRHEQTATASGINSLARMVGASIASPALSSVLVASIPAGAAAPAVGGYVKAFLIAAVGAAAAAAIVAAIAAWTNGKKETAKVSEPVGAVFASGE
jgi:MFS family permease